MSNFEVKYRTKQEDMIPSATHIDGEPVWAEIMDADEDLTAVYVTRNGKEAHVWIAYATDDPKATEFQHVYAYGRHNKDGDIITYPSYTKALEAAADIAGD